MQVNLETILLQSAPQTPGAGMPVFLMVGMFVVMYFFMIRPQAKRAKDQKKFAESTNTGDKIVTTAGIHGTINRINDDGTIQIEVGRNSYMTIERSAISMEMTANARKKADVANGITTVPAGTATAASTPIK